MQTIKIANKQIGKGCPCFIIAEAGVNHDGDFKKAKKLIDLAKGAGADAVKFQTWITEEILTKKAEQAEYQKENTGVEESQYEMIKRLELSFDEFKKLKKYAKERDIIFISTPDDEKSVDFLYKIGVPAFKIGSGELTNFCMLKKIAQKKKPIILSTGMSNIKEIEEAVKIIFDQNNDQLCLLHCTSNYPTKLNDVNLRAMHTLKDKFKVIVGYSDHTLSIEVPLIAVILGASVIEKHFTYDKNANGPDHKASLSSIELKKMIKQIRKIEKMNRLEKNKFLHSIKYIEVILGSSLKRPNEKEKKISNLVRKSIVAKHAIKKGTKITELMIALKRPGVGLSSKYINKIIGRVAKENIKKDQLITWSLIE